MSHKIALLMIAGAMLLLSGCITTPVVPININDSSATFVSARAEWHPHKYPSGQVFGEVSEGVELQYTRTTGYGGQSLATGEAVLAGGNSVTGPQQISHRVDISYAHLAYSGTAFHEDYPAEMDAFMGLGQVKYRLRSEVLTAPPLTLHASQTDYALTMGLGLRWRFVDDVSAEGRIVLLTQNLFSYFLNTFGSGKQTDMAQGELTLVYKPVKSLAVRGGYAWMILTPEKAAESPLEFRVSGPVIGLQAFF